MAFPFYPQSPIPTPVVYKARLIRRRQVQPGLAIAAVAALILSACQGSPTRVQRQPRSPEKTVEALYYKDAAACKQDMQKQAQEYKTLKEFYDAGRLNQASKPSPLKPEECDAQFNEAKKDYERTAPVYGSKKDCQADGVQCEPTPNGYHTRSYRPIWGGYYYYYYPYYVGGGYRSGIHSVYTGSSPNQVVSPTGRQLTPPQTNGRVSVPPSITAPAPGRPSGTAGKGAISGRSSTGFGSSFTGTVSRGG